MRHFLFLILGLIFLAPLSSWAESKLKTTFIRRFDRSTVKLVRLQFSAAGKELTLAWTAPSNEVIAYKVYNLHPGLRVKLKRYAKHNQPVAVGGRFQILSRNQGRATVAFAYRVHRYWRGGLAVKFDGWMPLYTVTRLPTPSQKTPQIYEVRGLIDTGMENHDNKLVCLYGNWFDLLDYIHPRTQQRRGMVSQVSGLKGNSLFWFPSEYKHPRSWSEIRDWKERLAAFRADRQQRAKGKPFVRPVLRIPLVSEQDLARFDRLCQRRMNGLEKKFATREVRVIEPLQPTPTNSTTGAVISPMVRPKASTQTSKPTAAQTRTAPFANPTNPVLLKPVGPATQPAQRPLSR